MPRPVMCDMGHEPPILYAYMVSDGDTGDTVALCAPCFADFAAGVLRAIGWQTIPPEAPEPDRNPGALGAMDPDRDAGYEQAAAEALATPDDPESYGVADRIKAEAHERRVADELAARPDGAKTSEAAVPWPSGTGTPDS